MKITYSAAPQKVIDIANEIIKQYHAELSNEKIAYVIKHGTWVKDGKDILGNVKKCSEKEILLTQCTFIITINSFLLYTDENILRAVIDHELSHCGVEINENGEIRRYMIPHDLEDFAHIIQRYGIYKKDVESFIQRVRQISFFEDERTIRAVK